MFKKGCTMGKFKELNNEDYQNNALAPTEQEHFTLTDFWCLLMKTRHPTTRGLEGTQLVLEEFIKTHRRPGLMGAIGSGFPSHKAG
jgi:hypothetical protein